MLVITFVTEDDHCWSVPVEPDLDVKELSLIVEAELGTPDFKLLYGEKEIEFGTLRSHGITKDEMILVKEEIKRRPDNDFLNSKHAVDKSVFKKVLTDIEQLRVNILTNPVIRQQMEQKKPEVVRAASENPEEFRRQMLDLQVSLGIIEARTRDEILRQLQIESNMLQAMEHHPEVFASVTMLYIAVKVNGVELKAFVDSGAQTTIITPAVAEKCGLQQLLDTRWSGVAQGVGTSRILGRIHSADLQLGSLWLPCSFTVLEQAEGPDMLLGLDMLRRYQACIDLAENVLRVHGEAIPFLPESEHPKNK